MRLLASTRWTLCALMLFGGLLLYAYSRCLFLLPTSMTGIMLDGARNLYGGKGLTTTVPTIGFLTAYKNLTSPFPYLWYPLVPFLTGELFHFFGVRLWVLSIVPVASYIGTAIALFLLGRKLFGPATAIASATFVLMQPILIDVSLQNPFTDPVLLFLLISCVLYVFRADESKRFTNQWLMLAGAVLGVAQYARSAGMLLYLPVIFLIASLFPQHRFTRLAAFLFPCFAIQVPLFVFTWKATGLPTFIPTYLLLYLTPSFPGYSASRMLLPARPLTIFKLYGRDILHKWVSQVWVHYKYFFTMMNPLVLVGALLTVSIPLKRRQAVFRNFAFVLYLCLAVQNSLVVWDNRYLLPVIPFFSLLGFEYIQRMFAALPTKFIIRTAVLTVLVLLLSTDTIDFYHQALKHRRERWAQCESGLELAQFIRDNVAPGSRVMTPDVGLMAWETGSVSVGIPLDFETAAHIYHDYVHFDTIILYPLGNTELYHFSPEWSELLEGRTTFLGFSPEKTITLASGEHVVLLRERMKEDLHTDVPRDSSGEREWE